MPNRILWSTISRSETLVTCDPSVRWFFALLITTVDDFGRRDARIPSIRADCYAFELDRVSEDDVSRYLAQLDQVDLVRLYNVHGRPYLFITTWAKYQRIRSPKSKYPEPPAALCGDSPRPAADCGESPPEAEADPETNYEMRDPEAEAETRARKSRSGRALAPTAHSPPPPPYPPPELKRFDATLRAFPDYVPDAAFYGKVMEFARELDVETIALKIADHHRRKRNPCTTGRVLTWLQGDLKDARQEAHRRKERTNGAATGHHQSDLAKY
jgi:hypothetical protein